LVVLIRFDQFASGATTRAETVNRIRTSIGATDGSWDNRIDEIVQVVGSLPRHIWNETFAHWNQHFGGHQPAATAQNNNASPPTNNLGSSVFSSVASSLGSPTGALGLRAGSHRATVPAHDKANVPRDASFGAFDVWGSLNLRQLVLAQAYYSTETEERSQEARRWEIGNQQQ
jgi:hypothetical protein